MRAIENSNMKKTTFEEFITLDYLKTTGKPASIARISNAVDKSEVTVKKISSILQERGMLKFDIVLSQQMKKDYYSITDKGSNFVIMINDAIKKMTGETNK